MTVGRLEKEISTQELAEWMAYTRIEADEDFRKEMDNRARAGAGARLAAAKRGRR